jgi:hypothetical protein
MSSGLFGKAIAARKLGIVNLLKIKFTDDYLNRLISSGSFGKAIAAPKPKIVNLLKIKFTVGFLNRLISGGLFGKAIANPLLVIPLKEKIHKMLS